MLDFDRCYAWISALVAPSPERRQSPRSPLHDSLLISDGSGFVYHGRGRDRSDAGLGAIVCGDLRVGDQVVVRMEGRRLRATVRNRNGYRYGFELVGTATKPVMAPSPAQARQ